MDKLCPHFQQTDQVAWIKEQTVQTLVTVLDRQTDVQYILIESAKVLRQRLRNHVNKKNGRQVPIVEARKWIGKQSLAVLRHAAEIVNRVKLQKVINDRIAAFTECFTVCMC